MAEAKEVIDQGSKAKSEFSITDCSICLERLRKPKSLPCLHTFCHDCLSTFITSNGTPGHTSVFFNCPVCRRKTLPIEPSSAHDQWASQFPTNNFVIEMMKKTNVNDTNKHLCQPCLQRSNEEISFSCWCQDCGHFLCIDCTQSHERLLFNHKTFTPEELAQRPALLIPVNLLCEKHGERQNLICIDHEILGCHTCIAIDHRKCDKVSTVTEYAESLKSKDKLTELAHKIYTYICNIDTVIAEVREKLDIATKDKDAILQKLSDVKKLFDAQISRLSDEVVKTYKDEVEKIHSTIEDMETVRSSLLQTKAMSDTTQRSGQEHQLVSTVLRGKSEMERCENIIQNKQIERVRIHVKLKDEVENLTNEKHDIGTVVVKKQSTDSEEGHKSKSLFGRTAKQIGSIIVPVSGQFIKGILVLPNGHLIVSDWSGKQLLYMSESGEELSTLKIEGNPFDICQMPDGDFGLAVLNNSSIYIVRLSSSQLSFIRDIKLTEAPLGIRFFDGALHMTTDSMRLHRVSDNGQLQQLQQFNGLSFYFTCSKSGSQLIGSLNTTTPTNSAVYCVSHDNTYSEVVKADVLKGARGIDVDDEDNIYVCGSRSNNVLQISADGSRTRELLSSNYVSTPFVINVCGEKLYIYEDTTRVINIYVLD